MLQRNNLQTQRFLVQLQETQLAIVALREQDDVGTDPFSGYATGDTRSNSGPR